MATAFPIPACGLLLPVLLLAVLHSGGLAADLESALRPPAEFAGDLGRFRPPWIDPDGRPARTPAEWRQRRDGLVRQWKHLTGPWPDPVKSPRLEILESKVREELTQHRVRVEIAAGVWNDGWLLVPARAGRMPAVLVPFYEPETSAGLKDSRGRDFGWQLARRGFVTLSIGSPGGDAWHPELSGATCQPLAFLAVAASNARAALARRPEVDPSRIGIVGHSYGGKWALFAAAFDEGFAACAVSDPGVVFDEARPNVNYWEPWYLGHDSGPPRRPGPVTPENPRTGAYRDLVASGHDLHEVLCLMAPRPFLLSGGSEDPPERWRALNHLVAVNAILGVSGRVAMTSRPGHDPTLEATAVINAFFGRFLGDGVPRTPAPPGPK